MVRKIIGTDDWIDLSGAIDIWHLKFHCCYMYSLYDFESIYTFEVGNFYIE